jgi:hypothetical protein
MQFGKRTSIGIGVLALLCSASVALADDPVAFPECTKAPSSDDVESAKQSHNIATGRFNLQDWDKAIEFWRQAYSFDCTAHALLVNMANAYEKKGDRRSAVMALETYMARAKDAPDLLKISQRVMDLKKGIEPEPTVTATATATAAPTPTVTTAPTTTASPAGARPFGPAPLIIAGVGGALAIAGAIMIPVGLGPYNNALDNCPRDKNGNLLACPLADAGNTGRITWNAGSWILGVGVVAAIGGVGFHFLFNKPKAEPTAQPATKAGLELLPVLSPQAGGLLLNGKF